MPGLPSFLLRLCLLSCLAGSVLAQGAGMAVDFLIDLRGEIAAGRFRPEVDSVGLRGAAPLSWQQSLPARPAGEPGLYALALDLGPPLAPGQALAYKFKIERPNAPQAGWEPGRNHSLLLRQGRQRIERAFGSHPGTLPLRRTGDIDTWAPRPSAFVTPRAVQVWLPPGYRTHPVRRYPVLYLHDGQNVFDAAAAGAEWGVDETAQRLVEAGEVAPMIIVAVAATDSRIDDYTPAPGRVDGLVQGGGAEAYARYLVDELKPAVDARYRTQPGRDSTAVGGASLGGLVSMWLLMARPETFGAALVVSPTVFWADGDILARVAAAAPPPGLKPPRIWLDAGELEWPAMIDGARRLRTALLALGWTPAYREVPAAGHDEASWAARVAPMLRFLYAHPPPAR